MLCRVVSYKGLMPKKPLKQFIKEMEALEQLEDKKDVHAKADDLLVQLVDRLSMNPPWVFQREKINSVIEAYTRLQKWYS